MRFIGNKEKVVDRIHQIMQEKRISGDSFFDFFAGSTSVSKYFKKLNYQMYSSDLLYFSYVLQRAYIANNNSPLFEKLIKNIDVKSNLLLSTPLLLVVEYLNQIKPTEGFIYKNYSPSGTTNLEQPRMYFSDENAMIIDSIRQQIESWRLKEIINDDEYFILLACLVETVPYYSNITGVYGAFQKTWDARAIKKLKLRPIEIITNDKKNRSFNENSMNLINSIKVDILYIDPPYNQRQYAPNYHLLETIAKYDNPSIKGVTGLREYKDQKSNFCNAKTAILELSKIAREAEYKTLMLSYNSEGIMPSEEIISTLQKYGEVELIEFQYARYKSNNNGESKTKKFINEQLYLLKKYEK